MTTTTTLVPGLQSLRCAVCDHLSDFFLDDSSQTHLFSSPPSVRIFLKSQFLQSRKVFSLQLGFTMMTWIQETLNTLVGP